MAAVAIENLTVAYERRPAIHHLSGRFAAGSLTAIVGPNGAGKTTLIKAIAGLLPIESGNIGLNGLARADIAYLQQQTEIDRRFPIVLRDVVGFGHWARIGAFGGLTASHRAALDGAIAAVGLSGFESRPVATLSAGQFQRALFARIVLQDAKLILLDEPFNGIDARTVVELIRILHAWHAQGRTVLCVTHDFDVVRRHFPETLLLARRPVAWGATAVALTDDNLARSRGMAEAWESDAAACAPAGVAA